MRANTELGAGNAKRRSDGASSLIELHIAELVLHGFADGERYDIAEGLQRELGRLLEQRGLSAVPSGDIEVEQLDGGSFRLPPAGKAAMSGPQIARAVFGAAASAMTPTEIPVASPAPGGEIRS